MDGAPKDGTPKGIKRVNDDCSEQPPSKVGKLSTPTPYHALAYSRSVLCSVATKSATAAWL